MILKAFQKGADGVFVGGCHIRDCHYVAGNYMTVKRIDFMHKLLEFTGIYPKRLCLKWVSSAEGPRFAKVVTDFTEKIGELGPSPLQLSRRSKLGRQGNSSDLNTSRLRVLRDLYS